MTNIKFKKKNFEKEIGKLDEALQNSKIYKVNPIVKVNMLPGDLNWSPDDCFFIKRFLGGLNWRKH